MDAPSCVRPDSHLTLHYRIALLEGAEEEIPVIDTFAERPATLQLGAGQLAPPLEARLVGMQAGQRARFDFPAGAAFGPRNPELIQKISRVLLDSQSEMGARYQPGDLVEFDAPGGSQGPSGARFAGVLKELNDHYALFDFNHPLAGRPVRFEVEIIGVL